MSIILRNLLEDELHIYSLFLSAARLSHKPQRGEGGWDIWVKDAKDEMALNAIQKYIDENQKQTNSVYTFLQKTSNQLLTVI